MKLSGGWHRRSDIQAGRFRLEWRQVGGLGSSLEIVVAGRGWHFWRRLVWGENKRPGGQ